MAIFQHKDVLIPTINFDLGNPDDCVWPLENSTNIDDIAGFKLSLREVIHDINCLSSHINGDLLNSVFKFLTVNDTSGNIQYDPTDNLPVLKTTLDTTGTYSVSRISAGFLSEASTIVALYYLTKKLSLVYGHFNQDDLIPNNFTHRVLADIYNPNGDIISNTAKRLSAIQNGIGSGSLTESNLPKIANHLFAILKVNGFNINFDSLSNNDKLDLISLIDPIIFIGIENKVDTIPSDSGLKDRIYTLANSWMQESKKLANFGINLSGNINDKKNRLAKVIDSILRGYSEVNKNHVSFWTKSLFHAVLPNKNYPKYSNALSTGDGTDTAGLLNYTNFGVILFTYSYKNDKRATINDNLSIGNDEKLTIESNTAIHLAIFGLDQLEPVGTPLPFYDPFQTAISTPTEQLNDWMGNSVITITNKKNGDKFEFMGNNRNNLFHYYYKKGSIESSNNNGIYTELISTITGAGPIYTVQYFNKNNDLIAEYQSQQKSLRFYFDNYLSEPFDITLRVKSANRASNYSSKHGGGNFEELQLLFSIVEEEPIVNIYLSEENLYPNDKFEVPIKKANTFFTNPSSYELGLELLIDLLPPNTTTPSESTVINPPILNGHFIGDQINDISENEHNSQILVQPDQHYKFITNSPAEADTDQNAYSHLRYSHAHIAVIPPQYPTFPYHRVNININSFVSPLRSRLDKRFQNDYRNLATIPSGLPGGTVPNISNLNSDYALPITQYYLVTPTGNIPSYNQPLAMFRSMGMLEGIYNRILNHPESTPNYAAIRTVLKNSINSAIAIDKSAIDRSLNSHIPPTSTDYNINSIDYTTFKTFKWYWLYHKDENSAIGDFIVNSVQSTLDLKAEFELSSLPTDQISENDYVFVSGFINNATYNGVKKVLSVNTATNKIKLDVAFGTNESSSSTKVFYYDRIQFYSEDFA